MTLPRIKTPPPAEQLAPVDAPHDAAAVDDILRHHKACLRSRLMTEAQFAHRLPKDRAASFVDAHLELLEQNDYFQHCHSYFRGQPRLWRDETQQMIPKRAPGRYSFSTHLFPLAEIEHCYLELQGHLLHPAPERDTRHSVLSRSDVRKALMLVSIFEAIDEPLRDDMMNKGLLFEEYNAKLARNVCKVSDLGLSRMADVTRRCKRNLLEVAFNWLESSVGKEWFDAEREARGKLHWLYGRAEGVEELKASKKRILEEQTQLARAQDELLSNEELDDLRDGFDGFGTEMYEAPSTAAAWPSSPLLSLPQLAPPSVDGSAGSHDTESPSARLSREMWRLDGSRSPTPPTNSDAPSVFHLSPHLA